jgi:hypothetical protein
MVFKRPVSSNNITEVSEKISFTLIFGKQTIYYANETLTATTKNKMNPKDRSHMI